MTAPVWIRGILSDHYGVPVDGVTYVTGGEESPGRSEKIKLDLEQGGEEGRGDSDADRDHQSGKEQELPQIALAAQPEVDRRPAAQRQADQGCTGEVGDAGDDGKAPVTLDEVLGEDRTREQEGGGAPAEQQ